MRHTNKRKTRLTLMASALNIVSRRSSSNFVPSSSSWINGGLAASSNVCLNQGCLRARRASGLFLYSIFSRDDTNDLEWRERCSQIGCSKSNSHFSILAFIPLPTTIVRAVEFHSDTKHVRTVLGKVNVPPTSCRRSLQPTIYHPRSSKRL